MNNLLLRLAAISSQKAIIFGVVASAIWYFLIFDDGAEKQKKLTQVEKDLQAEMAKEKESDEALREIAAIRASVGALTDQFKLVSAQLPTDLQMAEIIRTVDKVSQATGLAVKGKEPKPPVRQGVVEILPLRVTAEGTFAEITMFFYYLSTIERIVRVKSFTMTVPENRRPGKLTLDTDIVSYKFLPDEAGKK